MEMCWASLRWSKKIINHYNVFNRFYQVSCTPLSHLGQQEVWSNAKVLYKNNAGVDGGISGATLCSFPNNTPLVNQRFISVCCVMRKSKKKGTKPPRIDLNEAREVLDIEKFIGQMDHAIEKLKENYMKHLMVRSSAGSIEQVVVHFEGEEYILQELVQIVRKPNMMVLNVTSFPQTIPHILKALVDSGMNLNPQQDGTTVFIPIPKVTKEYREGLAKNAKALFIKSRDTIRDIRNKEIDKLRNIPSLPCEKIDRIHAQVELVRDDYVRRAESIFEAKKKELLGSSE